MTNISWANVAKLLPACIKLSGNVANLPLEAILQKVNHIQNTDKHV
jgi:hypothetical protein